MPFLQYHTTLLNSKQPENCPTQVVRINKSHSSTDAMITNFPLIWEYFKGLKTVRNLSRTNTSIIQFLACLRRMITKADTQQNCNPITHSPAIALVMATG